MSARASCRPASIIFGFAVESIGTSPCRTSIIWSAHNPVMHTIPLGMGPEGAARLERRAASARWQVDSFAIPTTI